MFSYLCMVKVCYEYRWHTKKMSKSSIRASASHGEEKNVKCNQNCSVPQCNAVRVSAPSPPSPSPGQLRRFRALASSAVSEAGQLRHLGAPGQLHHLRAPGQFGAVSEPFQAPLVLASSAVSGPRQLRRLRTLFSSAALLRALSSPATSASLASSAVSVSESRTALPSPRSNVPRLRRRSAVPGPLASSVASEPRASSAVSEHFPARPSPIPG